MLMPHCHLIFRNIDPARIKSFWIIRARLKKSPKRGGYRWLCESLEEYEDYEANKEK